MPEPWGPITQVVRSNGHPQVGSPAPAGPSRQPTSGGFTALQRRHGRVRPGSGRMIDARRPRACTPNALATSRGRARPGRAPTPASRSILWAQIAVAVDVRSSPAVISAEALVVRASGRRRPATSRYRGRRGYPNEGGHRVAGPGEVAGEHQQNQPLGQQGCHRKDGEAAQGQGDDQLTGGGAQARHGGAATAWLIPHSSPSASGGGGGRRVRGWEGARVHNVPVGPDGPAAHRQGGASAACAPAPRHRWKCSERAPKGKRRGR